MSVVMTFPQLDLTSYLLPPANNSIIIGIHQRVKSRDQSVAITSEIHPEDNSANSLDILNTINVTKVAIMKT